MSDRTTHPGKFTTIDGKVVHGELVLDGRRTTLSLHDDAPFVVLGASTFCMKGVLTDLTKITLVDCVLKQGPGNITRGTERSYFAEISPNYAVSGHRHIDPEEEMIISINFVVHDANSLFYDFDAFGHLIDAGAFIGEIVQAQSSAVARVIPTGPNPHILYHTGKREIFACETAIGLVSANHNPSSSWGGPDGVHLSNTISISIIFERPVDFDQALRRKADLTRFLEMVVGRPQRTLRLTMQVKDSQGVDSVSVYTSMGSEHANFEGEEEHPHPADILLDAANDPGKFSRVLSRWLDRQDAWRDARSRFSRCFAKKNYYDVDRLIAAANMFDILPASALPASAELSPSVRDSLEVTRALFKKLPKSPERDGILTAVGLAGKSNLKRKIRYRTTAISERVGTKLPELSTVTDEAVDCRNHYVHGGQTQLDYQGNLWTISFFINTLEFIFAASDLLDAGWDIQGWMAQGTTMSHPFGAYYVSYGEGLKRLKTLLPNVSDA